MRFRATIPGDALLAVAVSLGVSGLLQGCLPYSVGSTAMTLRAHEREQHASIWIIPNALENDSATARSLFGVDIEGRIGLDERSDLGLRLASGSGIILTYKRQLAGDSASGAVAIMPGLGFVNFGQHAYGELTLLASAGERGSVTPFGGARVMQVVPLSRGGVSDSPTIGGFVGIRIGTRTLGVSPELGIFHDRSALKIRRGSTIVVPSITLHGEDLMRLIRELGLPFGRV